MAAWLRRLSSSSATMSAASSAPLTTPAPSPGIPAPLLQSPQLAGRSIASSTPARNRSKARRRGPSSPAASAPRGTSPRRRPRGPSKSIARCSAAASRFPPSSCFRARPAGSSPSSAISPQATAWWTRRYARTIWRASPPSSAHEVRNPLSAVESRCRPWSAAGRSRARAAPHQHRAARGAADIELLLDRSAGVRAASFLGLDARRSRGAPCEEAVAGIGAGMVGRAESSSAASFRKGWRPSSRSGPHAERGEDPVPAGRGGRGRSGGCSPVEVTARGAGRAMGAVGRRTRGRTLSRASCERSAFVPFTPESRPRRRARPRRRRPDRPGTHGTGEVVERPAAGTSSL